MKRRNLSKVLVSSLAILLVVLLTGCGAAAPYASSASSSNEVTRSAAPAYIGLDKARQIALDRAGVSADDVRWEKAELDREDGVYELEFSSSSTEYDCEVGAVSGKIVKFEKETVPTAPAKPESTPEPAPETTQPAAPTYIGLDKARQIALDRAGVSADDVHWEKAELDREDGVYELEFSSSSTEYDCEVGTVSGKIVKFEKETIPAAPAKPEPKPEVTPEPTPETTQPAAPAYIGLEKARAVALDRAGVSADDVRWEKAELDREDGVYELEFSSSSTEYDCEVGAVSGKIVKFEADFDDDRYDRDDD